MSHVRSGQRAKYLMISVSICFDLQEPSKSRLNLIKWILPLYVGIPDSRCSLSRPTKSYLLNNGNSSYIQAHEGRLGLAFMKQEILVKQFHIVVRQVFAYWLYAVRSGEIHAYFTRRSLYGLWSVYFTFHWVFSLFLMSIGRSCGIALLRGRFSSYGYLISTRWNLRDP